MDLNDNDETEREREREYSLKRGQMSPENESQREEYCLERESAPSVSLN